MVSSGPTGLLTSTFAGVEYKHDGDHDRTLNATADDAKSPSSFCGVDLSYAQCAHTHRR